MIFILGMHRSGTSAITRLVADMGAYLGPESLLLAPSADNPAGFWERKDVLNLNRALLAAQGCNWQQVEGFNSTRSAPPELHEPMQACARQLSSHAPFVVKDPRFCLTLPYWRPLIPSPVVVLALRHPAAVSHSLQLRNAMPTEQGLALWEHYMTHALKNIDGLPVIRCQFESLLTEPEKETGALYKALARHFPGLTLPKTTSLNPALVHTPKQPILLSKSQHTLYSQL